MFENEWVLSNQVKSGNKVSVVDVTGCSGFFFWDAKNIPSAFHIFCGDETSMAETPPSTWATIA